MARFRTPRRPPPTAAQRSISRSLVWDRVADPSIRLTKDKNGKLIAVRNGQRLTATVAAWNKAAGAASAAGSGLITNNIGANSAAGNSSTGNSSTSNIELNRLQLLGFRSLLKQVGVIETPRTPRKQSSNPTKLQNPETIHGSPLFQRSSRGLSLDGADDGGDELADAGGAESAPRTPSNKGVIEKPSSLGKRSGDDSEDEFFQSLQCEL